MLSLAQSPITLRRLRAGDAENLAPLINNKKVWDNVRDFIPHPYTEKDAIEFITFTQQESIPMTFAICHMDKLCGVIGLVKQTDIYAKSAEIGYWLGEPFWGRGIATVAVKIITEYGFSHLGLVRIYAGIFEYNPASMRVLEKNGYQKEAIFEKALFKNGEIWNEHRYAKVK